MENQFLGKEFYWFLGHVENRLDPLLSGRVQVRCFVYHTNDSTYIPTDDLKWAQVMLPVSSSGSSGIGDSPTGLLEGSWVCGFFMDGKSCQHPLIVGSIPGVPSEIFNFDWSNGPKQVANRTLVTDNSTVTDKTFSPWAQESDTNRLSRNESIDKTIVGHKRNTLDQDIPTALGGSFSEPKPAYNAKYPYNHVHESESGHVHEIDDTPGSERLHTFHRTGTFSEIHPDGTRVEKNVRQSYTHTYGKSNEHVWSHKYVTVNRGMKLFVNAEGSNYNFDVEVGPGGDLNVTIDRGDVNLVVNGSVYMDVTGDIVRNVGGSITENVGGSITRNVVGDITETSSSHYIVSSVLDVSEKIVVPVIEVGYINIGTASVGTATVGTVSAGTVVTESASVESVSAGSVNAGSVSASAATVSSVISAGSVNAGSVSADSVSAGSVSADSVSAGPVTLESHKHGGVFPGAGETTPPLP